MFVATMLIAAVLFGAIAAFVVIPTAPAEPLGRELARVVPLSLAIGVVIAWVTSI